jgi:hypothetical protein
MSGASASPYQELLFGNRTFGQEADMNIRNTAIAILAVGAVVMGGSPAHAAPDQQVTGSGIVELVEAGGSARVSVAARVDPEADETTATGQVQILLDSGESVHGTVTCLTIRGQRVTIIGTLDHPIDGNGFFRLGVVDRAEDSAPDLGGLVLRPDEPTCSRATTGGEVTSGNFTVKGNG